MEDGKEEQEERDEDGKKEEGEEEGACMLGSQYPL